MTNREKFLKLVSSEETNTVEKAKERLNNLKQNKMKVEQEKENLGNRLKEIEIELEKQPKIGDVCWFWDNNKEIKVIGLLEDIDKDCTYKYVNRLESFLKCEKITDPYIINFVKGLKVYTIEDLSKGICAVINDGTKEQLKAVLRKAFPKDNQPNYMYRFYFRNVDDYWNCDNSTSLPTQSVKDFLLNSIPCLCKGFFVYLC